MSTYPLHFFTQPFCEAGDKTIPTDVPPAEGRTSLPLGFPPETQKPIRDGGIAPDRWDFNGILYMLSALAYWQQAAQTMRSLREALDDAGVEARVQADLLDRMAYIEQIIARNIAAVQRRLR